MMVKDREVWCVGVHGIAKSWAWLSTWTTTGQWIHMIISKIKSNKREPCMKNVIDSGLWVYQLCTQALLQEQWTLCSFENFRVLYKCKMIYCYYTSIKMVIFWGNLPYCFRLNYLQVSSKISIEHIYLELWIIYKIEGVVKTNSI